MGQRNTNIALFCLAVVCPTQVNADESQPAAYDWKNTWASPYSKALGGSQTAHASNEDALFANPAGLSKTRHPRSKRNIEAIDAPGLSVGGNKSTLSALKGKSLKPSDWLKSFAGQSTEDRNYLEAQLFPWTVMGERGGPSFFVGLPMRTTLVANPSVDNGLSRTVLTETTATAAMNVTLTSRTGTAAVGLSLRPNIRWNSSSSYTIADMVSSKTVLSEIKSDVHKTSSTPIDIGFLFSASDFWLPAFGLSVLNLPTACVDNFINPATGKNQSICGAKRSGDKQDNIPGTIIDPTEIRAGFSLTPRFRLAGTRINLKISGDVYPLPISTGGKNYGFTDVNINQLPHAGIELFLGNAMNNKAFSIRGGLNDTRVSWGISVPLANASLDLSSFDAPIFTAGKANPERRYLLGLSSHW